jgi:hypothetical protein
MSCAGMELNKRRYLSNEKFSRPQLRNGPRASSLDPKLPLELPFLISLANILAFIK